MLPGVRDIIMEVGTIDQDHFFIGALVYHCATKLKIEFIGVYGSSMARPITLRLCLVLLL
jgi:hypothetical protein